MTCEIMGGIVCDIRQQIAMQHDNAQRSAAQHSTVCTLAALRYTIRHKHCKAMHSKVTST